MRKDAETHMYEIGERMKTYECIARSGNTGKEIVVFVRAVDASQAKMNALVQARRQFGSGAGSVTVVGCKELR
jgi:hypothetical protein